MGIKTESLRVPFSDLSWEGMQWGGHAARLPADCWNQASTPRALTFCPGGQEVTSSVCWHCKKLLYFLWPECLCIHGETPFVTIPQVFVITVEDLIFWGLKRKTKAWHRVHRIHSSYRKSFFAYVNYPHVQYFVLYLLWDNWLASPHCEKNRLEPHVCCSPGSGLLTCTSQSYPLSNRLLQWALQVIFMLTGVRPQDSESDNVEF